MHKTELKHFFTSHWSYMALSTACELEIFDLIKAGHADEINLNQQISPKGYGLKFILQFLEDEAWITRENGKYFLSPIAEQLTKDHPQSWKYACMLWKRYHLNALQNLKESILSDRSYFEKTYGNSYFDFIKTDLEEFEIYHRAMDEYAREDYKEIATKLEITGSETIMDIGGGSGRLLTCLSRLNAEKSFYLFDEPEVLELFNPEGIHKIPGNFFNEIPLSVDMFILSRVLHDWDDQHASSILKNVFNRSKENGKLIVIENCEDLTKCKHSLLSLNMLAVCRSFERTSSAYKNLVESVGFRFESIIQLNDLQFIIQFTKP